MSPFSKFPNVVLGNKLHGFVKKKSMYSHVAFGKTISGEASCLTLCGSCVKFGNAVLCVTGSE